jgi:hypothetical protein
VDDLAGAAQHRDCLGDLAAVVLVEGVQVGLDAADQLPHPSDLLLRWGCGGAGPVLQVGGGQDAFAVGQQLLQVRLQLGQIRRVAAKVAAAHTDVAVGAGGAPGLDVAGLGADAEGNRDLADSGAGVLSLQGVGDLAQDPAAVAVELMAADPVDRGPDSQLGHPVVALGGLERLVPEQLPQHVHGHPAVGVPLGVAMPIG